MKTAKNQIIISVVLCVRFVCGIEHEFVPARGSSGEYFALPLTPDKLAAEEPPQKTTKVTPGGWAVITEAAMAPFAVVGALAIYINRAAKKRQSTEESRLGIEGSDPQTFTVVANDQQDDLWLNPTPPDLSSILL